LSWETNFSSIRKEVLLRHAYAIDFNALLSSSQEPSPRAFRGFRLTNHQTGGLLK